MKSHDDVGGQDGITVTVIEALINQLHQLAKCGQVGESKSSIRLAAHMKCIRAEQIGAVAIGAGGGATSEVALEFVRVDFEGLPGVNGVWLGEAGAG